MSEPDNVERAFTQNVTAVNGFAYGAVGADIHVFGSGLPLYLLTNWQPPVEAEQAWLREMPSRMLNARRAVVPFTGRDDELALLRQWREGGPRLAVRWLHGPGGQGKTRLAAELAADSAAVGWKVIAATHGPDADRPEPGSQDMRVVGRTGLLVIVDYADRWLLTNLTWLMKNSLLHQTAVPTRVLMLARAPDAWPSVRGVLDTHQAATSSQPLAALPQESSERTSMFTAARDSFSAVYQVPRASAIGPPGPLADSEFGLTLALHMAALVAVDAYANGNTPPHDMAGLTMYLLDREQLHWARLYGDGAAATVGAERRYSTPPEFMNHAVFAAALTGSLSPARGAAVLENLQLPHPMLILKDHAVCYPAAELGYGNVLEPLYPDRLAEDFLALTMPGHVADYPAQPWAATSATKLLARSEDHQALQAWTPRALTFLASAAQRWPHLSSGYLFPMLLTDPKLAVEAGNAALTAIADLPSMDPALMEAINACLPRGRHVDLDTGIAALFGRLTRHRLATTTDPASRARMYVYLGWRMHNAGEVRQALTAAEEAVQIYRGLAASNPSAFEEDLARALHVLGSRLSSLGRREEALSAAAEGLQIQRRLAAARPAAHEHRLAEALTSVAHRLDQLGRHEDAVSTAAEGVQIRRRLAAANPAAYSPNLATELSNFGAWLSGMGRHEEALNVTAEALQIHRRLAAADPAVYEPSLAFDLNNLGLRLANMGRRQEALATAEEAVQVFRRLTKANPAAFEPDMARATDNLGQSLSDMGRRNEALTATQEAAQIRRRLAKQFPATYEPDLAASLHELSLRYTELGQPKEALLAVEAAVGIRQRLAKANPAAHEPGLAVSINSLALRLAETGEPEAALTAALEATQILQRLANANPASFEPPLAGALDNLAKRQSHHGDHEKALISVNAAVQILRRLVQANSARYQPDFAIALNNLGLRLSDLGRRTEAVAAVEEAIQIQRQLAAANPAVFEHGLAASLTNLSIWLSDPRRHKEAQGAGEEAVQIYRKLAGAYPTRFEPSLALALNNLGACLWRFGQRPLAVTATEEAVRVRRRLAAAQPASFEPDLGSSLCNLSMMLAGLGRRKPALAAAEQAAEIYRRLSKTNPAKFEPLLARAIETISKAQSGKVGKIAR